MQFVMATILFLIFGTICLKISLFVYNHLSLRKRMSSIPGPKSLPFIGNSLELQKIPFEDFFRWMTDKCFEYKGGMVLMWLGIQPSIAIRKPHQMEIIMRSQTLLTKSKWYDFLAHWLGNGLITSTGDVWRHQRRIIEPAFSFTILNQFNEIFLDKVTIFNSIIQLNLDKNPNEPINIFPMAIKYTLDITCETVMGIDMDIQRKPENEYVKAFHRFTELAAFRYMRFWLWSDFIFYLTKEGQEYRKTIDDMHAFTAKVIDEKRISRQEKQNRAEDSVEEDDDIGKRKTKAFLDHMMDLSEADENSLTDVELREQVDTFMFGGHDTSGIAISYALFCLGNEPEIQRKVHEEIDEILGDDERPNKTQLSKLVYLDRVIKESLRMFPSAPTVSRALDHDVVIDGYTIPKGTTIDLNIFQLHRDPVTWENPEKYDPDRFLPENSHDRSPYAYAPFSAGPRNCIGQKFALSVLKVSLACLLKKWSVKSVLKMNDLKLSARVVMTPPNRTINLYFKSRTTIS